MLISEKSTRILTAKYFINSENSSGNQNDRMESSDISKLASVLRENGDKVLNACTKLSLSTFLLQTLNKCFSSIVESDEDDSSHFQVIKTYNSRVEFLHDVHFLHDFVQKTVGLKISQNPVTDASCKGTVDISKFKTLKCLELRKVPVTVVSGIQGIRGQLQSLVCIRCIQRLEDILANCGADNSAGFTWSELREAVFTYNTLESLDTSLKYAPWLQIIDVSHNRLRNVTAIDCLPNLKYLNISYNLLDSVPAFNKSACRKMQVLIMKNNYVEDLSGLIGLENLLELDLTCNCLTDHEGLSPLLRLPSLNWLSLVGNPLSFHSKHRFYTLHYLHKYAATEKFVLDNTSLSKSERLIIRKTCSSLVQQKPISYGDNVSFHSGSSSATSSKTQVPEQVESQTGRPRKSRRNRPAPVAVISEQGGNVDDETDTLTGSLEASMDHLETKRQIEMLRERFGEERWLIQHSGSCVQDVLGLHSENSKDEILAMPETSETVVNKIMQEKSSPDCNGAVLHPDESTVVSEFPLKEENTSQTPNEPPSTDQEMNIQMEEEEEEKEEEMEDDDEAEQQLYTVQRLQPGTQHVVELFLAVTDRYLKEREIQTGRIRERWAVDTLMSCMRTCNSPVTVQLSFDTVRRDRQEREYIMDDLDAQNLVRSLGSILDSRSLSAMNQIPYRCMKCSTQFSHEIDLRHKTTALIPGPMDSMLTCPSCGSKMVIEMDEEPLPAQKPVEDESKGQVISAMLAAPVSLNRPAPAQSPSQSSIGRHRTSAGESLQVSVMVHQSDVPCLPPQPALVPARSAASLDSPNSNSTVAVRRYDSDIEVISNPSQSSIEVLEGESRTPGRKRSSEERQSVVVPQAEVTVTAQSVGQALTAAGLTESSSSGSLTDSVCTTYEHHLPSSSEEKGKKIASENGSSTKIDIISKKPLETTVEEESAESANKETEVFSKPHSPVKDFTAMFEGLLQSVSSKFTNQAPVTATASPPAIEYSYTDFSRVDHRIKLHLYQHVLENEFEELILLLRASVLFPSASPFPGCLVLSTSRVYVLKISGKEGDDPEVWLTKVESFSLSQLVTLFVLPWNQGVGLELQESTSRSILFLIQDQQWTSNFLSFLSDAPLPKTCELKCEPPDYHQLALNHLLLSSAPSGELASTVRVLAVFNSCTISGDKASKLGMGAIIVTASDLIVTQDDLQWLFPNSTVKSITAHRAQKMNDLLEVELNGLLVVLQFLDEAAGLEELWGVVLQTHSAVQTVIRAIQVPWEQLFSVPLQITRKTEMITS